jgi:hypothetical protein
MSTIRETASTSSPGAGTSRSGGIVISFVTAITVFAVGQVIVSHVRGSANLAPEAVVSPDPPPPPAPPAAPAAAPAAAVVAAGPAQAEAPAPAPGPSGNPQADPARAAATAPQAEAPAAAAPSAAVVAPAHVPGPTPAAREATAAKTEPAAVAPAPTGTAAPAEEPAATAPAATANRVAKTKVKEKSSSAPVAAAALPTAGASAKAATEARAEAEAPPAEKESPPAATERQKAAAVPTLAATVSDKPSDRDLAREAWRRNLPDISAPEETRASILIPIKGSIEGATYHINSKPKSVIINLPKAESLITMRFYKIKREGFGNLWIKQEDGEGTTLKLMLNEATTPQVEIKDEYIRINVRKPADLAPKE